MYTKYGLWCLMQKAREFGNLEYLPFDWFYRDMEQYYYDMVMYSGRMKARCKDNNGDPESPINGRLQGVNFLVNVSFKTGEPMVPSIYGNRRIKINAFDVYNMCPNLYFADFYCYGNGGHHLTLVMTTPGSPRDSFCRKHLPKLNLDDNDFLHFPDEGKPMVLSNGIWTEVIVTEDLYLNELFVETGAVKWRHCNIVAQGKDLGCGYCNI